MRHGNDEIARLTHRHPRVDLPCGDGCDDFLFELGEPCKAFLHTCFGGNKVGYWALEAQLIQVRMLLREAHIGLKPGMEGLTQGGLGLGVPESDRSGRCACPRGTRHHRGPSCWGSRHRGKGPAA